MEKQKRYFVKLSYKGTSFHGWQEQPNAVSVQQVLNQALSLVLRESVKTVGCGRTDTGVHALEFFAHFDTCHEIQNAFFKSINSIVGPDISVQEFMPVRSDAHARFDALSRSYEYRICMKKNPFLYDFVYIYPYELDLDAMNKTCELLMNYRDFSCFSKSNTQTFTNYCHIFEAHWYNREDVLVFEIKADRFLRNMVRAIVGTMLDIGRDSMDPKYIIPIIESKNRSMAGESVPARGLFLKRVEYPENYFQQ